MGNPNVGKSTLFNALTGARQQVGNWPGKTVQVASGSWSSPVGVLRVVDLPGTYSLVPRSPDEALVRDLLADRDAEGRPDVVVAVLDAANLARNLYLLAQLLDTGVPVVVALTMRDLAAGRGVRVDPTALSRCTGVPVVEVDPRAGDGLDTLARALTAVVATEPARPVALGAAVEDAVARLVARIETPPNAGRVNPRWLALNLLARDDEWVPECCASSAADLRARASDLRREVTGRLAPDGEDDMETAVADQRYGWIRRVVAASVHRPEEDRPTLSDRVDRVLTNRWIGLPIFLLVMWAVFEATTRVAAPLQNGLSALVDGPVRGAVAWLLARPGLDDTWLAGLVLDGLVAGVGQLLTFVPLMAIMFVLLALLEDSGYLARAAFVADRFLRLVGLPGHAFLPLIVGFGCNVPAIAATRILADTRHRLMTALLVPFISCSARLTVYLLLANVFFGSHAGTVVFAMYLLSVVLVVGVGIALRHTLLRHLPRGALLLELPPYRRPTVRVVAGQAGQKLQGFLRTASGIIVATVTAVWLLTAIPTGHGQFGKVDVADSLYAGISRTVAPVFAPAGFDDWHATGALVTGFVAKEAVVSTFAQTYHAAEPDAPQHAGDLGVQLRATFEQTSGGHPAAAVLAFLVFLLAYTPCMATLAAQRAEIGPRWTVVGVVMQLAVAFLLAVAVFQIGRLLT
ncbi:MAG: ferrous iron transport protein B [Micromonospora sp.]